MELLTTKYRVPYESLCNEFKESQAKLRMDYMKSIRTATDLIAESVYMDLSNDEEWKKLLHKCQEICSNNEQLTQELIKAFVLTINSYAR